MVINFSPIREKKKSQPQIKAFPGKWQNISHKHSSRDTEQVPLLCQLHQMARMEPAPGFSSAPFMQSTLAWAPLLANSMQLVVKSLLSGTRTSNTGYLSRSSGIICLDKEGDQPSTKEGFSDMLEPIIFKGFVQLLKLLSPNTKKTSYAPFTTLKRAVKHLLCQLRAK